MGVIVPEHFPLSSLKNDSEIAVVEALRDQLTDGWLILPDIGLALARDWQMDVVIAHEREGIAVIEVKGHSPRVERGVFMVSGSPMSPQPLTQARDNSYALRDRLRSLVPGLEHLKIAYGVVFPRARAIHGSLPQDMKPSQVMTSKFLEDARGAVDALMAENNRTVVPREGLQAIIDVLRPNADFRWDPEWRSRHARTRIEQVCGQHVRVLERMDANRRVVATGEAGTGKTRLALAWALRALMRNERTLVTCYNEPLGETIAHRMPADNGLLTVGAFFPMALGLEGMPPLDVPDGADSEFWDYRAVGHLQLHWPKVTARFDTIVIDEAQDFSPAWIAMLTQLLDPNGPGRLLMVADEGQTLYRRGFTLPGAEDGWVRCGLLNNCRNTASIARMLRDCFDGAPPPIGGPEVDPVRWQQADTLDDAIEAAGAEYDRIVETEGHAATRVLFATFSTATRNALREAIGFVPWEAGSTESVVCETVHRVKGLEFDYVVVVAGPDDKVNDQLLYIGCSRAVAGLSVIGPSAVGDRLRLT